jgi:hypothetical protein
MDTSLNLSNLGFALLDEGFLVCDAMRREQRLQSLGLQLLGYNFGALITLSWSRTEAARNEVALLTTNLTLFTTVRCFVTFSALTC